jgi:hypothetical protein
MQGVRGEKERVKTRTLKPAGMRYTADSFSFDSGQSGTKMVQ